MVSKHTIDLLKECNSGTKMAVSSIDEVLDKVDDGKLKDNLIDFKDKHSKLGNQIHTLLSKYDEDDKEPHPIAKGMSWVKTNMKLAMKESDQTIADLMVEGCNMGVKSLSRYLNEYENADNESKRICNELISCEDNFAHEIRSYL